MRMRVWTVVCAVLGTGGLAGQVTAGEAGTQPSARYRIVSLGTLGGDSSLANAIDPNGRVAGSAGVTYAKPHYFWQGRYSDAFLWDGGTMSDLGHLPGSRTPTVFVSALNSRGDVAGAEFDGNGGGNIAFCRIAGKFTNLAPPGTIDSHAMGINDAGVVVGRACGSHGYAAYAWTDGKLRPVGDAGAEGIEANGINNHNQIVGMAVVSLGPMDVHGRRRNCRAVVWDAGKRKDLGDLLGSRDDGPTYSDAFAINDDGGIAGESYAFDSGIRHACLWKDGKLLDLGALPDRPESSARALNRRGQVVGWSERPGHTRHAFFFEEGRIFDLNDLVPADSGWELLEATGINDRGEICGNGWNRADHRALAFMLKPINGPGRRSGTGSLLPRSGLTARGVTKSEPVPFFSAGPGDAGSTERGVAVGRAAGWCGRAVIGGLPLRANPSSRRNGSLIQ